jgi:hypothetical protein
MKRARQTRGQELRTLRLWGMTVDGTHILISSTQIQQSVKELKLRIAVDKVIDRIGRQTIENSLSLSAERVARPRIAAIPRGHLVGIQSV